MPTILLLLISNIFMTLAWYGHLKFPHLPMLTAILIGWGIALIEYSFAVSLGASLRLHKRSSR